ncbi:MAG TPA: GNAT family N-acetyltransferase [Dehalococcoidia bacterium]
MNGPATQIAPFEEGDRAACAAVLARLPAWFGFQSVNEAYIAALGRLPTWVARRNDAAAGFIALEVQTAVSAEIHILAVAPELHRTGIGSALVAQAEAWLQVRDYRLLYLLTLGPSDPDAGYARTRAFYAARGFMPLFESTAFWGEAQPALVLVKVLAQA